MAKGRGQTKRNGMVRPYRRWVMRPLKDAGEIKWALVGVGKVDNEAVMAKHRS